MSKMLSVRVPDEVYAYFQEKAKRECRTLSGSIIAQMKREANPEQVVSLKKFSSGMVVGQCPYCLCPFETNYHYYMDSAKYCKYCGGRLKWSIDDCETAIEVKSDVPELF